MRDFYQKLTINNSTNGKLLQAALLKSRIRKLATITTSKYQFCLEGKGKKKWKARGGNHFAQMM